MKLTTEEIQILKDLADSSISPLRRGPRPADYDTRRQERLSQWRQVGDLINRYEASLNQN